MNTCMQKPSKNTSKLGLLYYPRGQESMVQYKGHRVNPCSGKFPHVVIQLFSHIQLFAAPWTTAHQASLSFTSPRFCSNSWPFSHSTISSSVPHFSSCPQSLPESGSFPVNWPITLGGQSIAASVSALVLPKNIQGWFSLGLTGLISLQSKGLSRVFSSTTVQMHQFFATQSSLWSNSHIHTWLLEKP